MICGSCHSLDSQYRIFAQNGWINSRQQFAEWYRSSHNTASQHYGYLTCATCHNQHKSAVYNQGGVEEYPTCSACHPGYTIPGKEYLPCIECHMPYSVKTASVRNEYRADMRSHQFKIWVTTFPKDSMFITDSTGTYVRLDSRGQVHGNTLDVVCLRCHSSWNIADAYPIAENIHQEGLDITPGLRNSPPAGFALSQNYPNPFNGETNIEFSLQTGGFITLTVFDLNGKLVDTILNQNLSAGAHNVAFQAKDLPSGFYFCRLANVNESVVKKMLILK